MASPKKREEKGDLHVRGGGETVRSRNNVSQKKKNTTGTSAPSLLETREEEKFVEKKDLYQKKILRRLLKEQDLNYFAGEESQYSYEDRKEHFYPKKQGVEENFARPHRKVQVAFLERMEREGKSYKQHGRKGRDFPTRSEGKLWTKKEKSDETDF